MNDHEAFEYIYNYFDQLFGRHNISALDFFLDQDYFDEDIGDPAVDHIKNSKEYLARLFREQPTIGVDVKSAVARDDVISAFLEWHVTENSQKRVIRKGVANFVVKNGKIIRRHTFVYYEE
jgi:hypothetical protein